MKKEEETLAVKEDENREERSKQEEGKHDVVDLGREENVVKHEDSPAQEDLQTLQV